MSMEEKDLFDPETGEPLTGEAADRFDPETGEPLTGEAADRFDPETGEPLTGEAADRFDPETGEPLTGETADRFDPETGEPLDRFDPETGRPISRMAAAGGHAAVLAGKGKVLLGVGAAVVAGAAVIGVTATAGGGLFKDKKDIVVDALAGIVETLDEGYLEETFGIKELRELAKNGSVKMGGALTMDEIPGWITIPEINGSLAFSRDPGKNAVQMDAAVGVGGMDFGDFVLYMDDSTIAAAAPKLMDFVLTLNYQDDFINKMEDSVFGREFRAEKEDSENVSRLLGHVNGTLTGKEEYFNLFDIYERYKETTKAVETLKDAMEVESIDAKKFKIKGKEQKCKGYEVVIPNEALADLVKEAGKYITSDQQIRDNELELLTDIFTLAYEASTFSSYDAARDYAERQVDWILDGIKSGSRQIEDFLDDNMEDLEFTLYVDKKGNAAYLEFDSEVFRSTEVYAEFHFEGGEIPTRDMNGSVSLEQGSMKMEMEVTKREKQEDSRWMSELELEFGSGSERMAVLLTAQHDKKSGDFSVEGELEENGTVATAELGGIVLDHKKGKSVDLELDTLEIKSPYINFDTDLALSLYMEPLSGGLSIPDGTEFNVLEAGMADWESLGEELMEQIREFQTAL